MAAIVCLLAGYLVGMINPAYLIGKRRGINIKKEGSGNAGGSNALLTMGKGVGVFCMLFDIAKAFAIIRLMEYIYPDSTMVFSASMVGVIFGHMFPCYLRFNGGKGLACLGGAVLAFRPTLFVGMLLFELGVALITNYLCFVPISAALLFPVIYWSFTQNTAGTFLILFASAAILLKHVENLIRIKNGTEVHFSYLWKKEHEMARVMENAGILPSDDLEGREESEETEATEDRSDL